MRSDNNESPKILVDDVYSGFKNYVRVIDIEKPVEAHIDTLRHNDQGWVVRCYGLKHCGQVSDDFVHVQRPVSG